VVLIRHGEVAGGGLDPGLSPAGQSRAQELIHVLDDTGVTAIIVSHFVRTQQTAAPLATHLGLIPQQISATDTTAIRNAITAAGAGVILIIGHSNTVPGVIQALGAGSFPDIVASEFDNMFVVQGSSTVHLRYGA
jgi:phosphohistidine phosphatase SixA